jgi:hypothetical protein
MKNSLLTVLAVSSLVVLGACAGDEAAEEANLDTTVEEVAPPAPMPMDSAAMDTTAADTAVQDTTP